MAKGKIARFEQFLLLSLCFQKKPSESVYMRERVNQAIFEAYATDVFQPVPAFNTSPLADAFKHIMAKG